MRALLLLLMVFMFSLSSWAQSNPPALTPRESTGKQQAEPSKAEEKNKAEVAEALRLVYEKIATFRSEYQAYVDRKHEEEKTHNEALIAYGTWALAVITFFLFIATYRLYKITVRLAADAKSASDRQFDSQVAAERGYAKVSHLVPGVRIQKENKFFYVDFEIKNWGRTPIHVTDVRFDHTALEYGTPLPTPFPFRNARRESFPNGFLVPGESMFVRDKPFTLLGEKGLKVVDGTIQRWIFAHVYYADVFGKRWVGGYVRKYVRIIDDGLKNNLLVDTEAIYDFDRAHNNGDNANETKATES